MNTTGTCPTCQYLYLNWERCVIEGFFDLCLLFCVHSHCSICKIYCQIIRLATQFIFCNWICQANTRTWFFDYYQFVWIAKLRFQWYLMMMMIIIVIIMVQSKCNSSFMHKDFSIKHWMRSITIWFNIKLICIIIFFLFFFFLFSNQAKENSRLFRLSHLYTVYVWH